MILGPCAANGTSEKSILVKITLKQNIANALSSKQGVHVHVTLKMQWIETWVLQNKIEQQEQI